MWSSCTLPQRFGFGKPNMSFLVRPISAPSLYSRQSDRRSLSFGLLSPSSSFHSTFGQSIRMEHSLTRSWLVKLWAAEKRKKIQRRKRSPQITKPVQGENTIFEALSSFRLPSFGSVLNKPVVAKQERGINRTINHPPIRQFGEGFLSPSSEEELLRTRRPFVASIIDGMGNEIFKLFTDAGQYVIRFGDPDPSPKFGMTSVIPELEVTRPLTLTERAVAVALAVSLDTDYFSRRGGWGLPILIVGE
ncbi:hypothetical protein J5N97_016663 [Dioscorea zingiberensis]|uniref:Phospholipid scramblase n=1 Tax=Dioscorea zingiberensis TaxID=325984 RepID=A0A9D5CJV7_9LILI|nr:hypothetical protein J5N97_016645 [Dioscorea zingiberensis]KAJ0974698.1 hypothetical protein J5N97_016663 [Dioscorea zingiberensis]